VRKGPLLVLGLVAFGVVVALAGRALRMPQSPRSVVLITVDTLRADRVGAYGRSPSITPRLDELAARGTIFTRCWTTAPLTVPAHASALTGLSPPLHGLRTNNTPGRIPPPSQRPYPTLAEMFRAGGAATGAFVSASVLRKSRTGLDWGFDVYDDVAEPGAGSLHFTERRGEETVARALEWARGQAGPIFLWVHLFDPHAPYDAPPPYGRGRAESASAAGYDGEVEYADHCVGRLLDGLEAAGHGGAIVAVASDHGEGLGEHGEATHGWLLHEATLRIPLIISVPGRADPEAVRDDPASLADLPATLATLAGLPVQEGLFGTPLFSKKARTATRHLYAETLYGYESCRWAQMLAHDDGERKLVAAGPFALVYDLADDPAETRPERFALPDGAGADSPELRFLTDRLLPGAAREPLADLTARASLESAPGYFAPAGGAGGPLLPLAENALLPSPYERMDVLAKLDRARSLLAAHRAPDAVTLLTEVTRTDPQNPQAARWLARALLEADRPAEAMDGYHRAFELGWTSPDCLSKASQAAYMAADAGTAGAREAGLAFLERARGKGVVDDGFSLAWEALLRHALDDAAGAQRALERARAAPRSEALDAFLANVAGRLAGN